jgi:transcriptional regulator with XRE-family HTH domain
MLTSARSAGDLLREWRQRRRMTQLDLALEAEISTRHLSFIETGRAQPSREMLLRLAEQVQLPLRERNALLVAGGFAPAFPERAARRSGPARAACRHRPAPGGPRAVSRAGDSNRSFPPTQPPPTGSASVEFVIRDS